MAEILQNCCKWKADSVPEQIANCLRQSCNRQTMKMAMAIIANALAFHETIAGIKDVPTINKTRGKSGNP